MLSPSDTATRDDTTFGIQIFGLYPNIPESVGKVQQATFIVRIRQPSPK